MVHATAPETVKNQQLLFVPYVTAGLFCAMAVLQLVNFEAFVTSIEQYHLSAQPGSIILAVTLIGLEILAIPFLLHLWMSRLGRWFSASFVLFLPFVWLFLQMWTVRHGQALANAGLFGDLVPLASGVVASGVTILLGVLAVWSFCILNGAKAWHMR